MNHLELVSVSKSFGNFVAVDGVSFTLEKGERLSLLGPSGCGKTTLLNVIAGFARADSGKVVISGRDMSGVEAYRRNIGVVFQNYALFPHLTVRDNIYFGLKMRGLSRADAKPAIAKAVDLVRLGGFEERYPMQLSGGQQQRVAIARAIAIEPQILCLDEPLSNLDAKLREEMRTDILEILDDLSTTTIFVTHDQSEALSLSHRVAVLNRGRVEQIGKPEQVYEHPSTNFVAGFLGESNIFKGLPGGESGGQIRMRVKGGLSLVGRGRAAGPSMELNAYVRAERILASAAPVAADNALSGTLRHAIYVGNGLRLVIDTDLQRIIVHIAQAQGPVRELKEGGTVHLGWSACDTIVMPAAEGAR